MSSFFAAILPESRAFNASTLVLITVIALSKWWIAESFNVKNPRNFNNYENKLFRKILDWPKIVDTASKKLEPHRIPFYLYELANLFHTYWSKGNEDKKFKFIENGKIKRMEILVSIYLISIVLTNGMDILGVSLPEKM